MVATIEQGQLITVNKRQSDAATLERYFEPVKDKEDEEKRYYTAKQKLLIFVEDHGDHGWALLAAAPTLSELVKLQKNQKKRRGEKRGKKVNLRKLAQKKAKQDARKPERRVLWFSRHNMDTRAYFALEQEIYPNERLRIIPYQTRIVEGADVLRIAEQYACDTICAVLKVQDGINQYDEILAQAGPKLDVFRPLFSQRETGRNFSPKGSMKVLYQDAYDFCGWMDMRTRKIYGTPVKGKDYKKEGAL